MVDKYVVVPQFDGATELLRIDLCSGAMEVVAADTVDVAQLAFGMFERETLERPTQPVAFLATPDGPLLLLGSVRCRPAPGQTLIHVGSSYVQVRHEGRHLFGQHRTARSGIGLHPYNNCPEDVDFWRWLERQIDDPRFYATYTRPIRYLG
ncbi:hypothetical protein [Pseudoduganella chitinolytica]|uniref:Uncharacterized protein n=1 Tax=Pseudoduganella chitinolytica TaxID=34070 RepID=A0ABY8B6K3_9BURK|nr:hypothetical protein [Pseudoduganella chitinolytica]WEF30633.1 hypothetical protein PX653_14210 [Pseudoduganella chitinolytica]